MKKNYSGLRLILLSSILLVSGVFTSLKASTTPSGDTTVVNTFNYSNTARSGMFQFPSDTTKTYEKIIMLYSMRCKNGQISTQTQRDLGCGEWDYNCNTYIVDSSLTDSLRLTRGDHAISNWTDTVFPYTNVPQWNYIQYNQQDVTYTSTISESTAVSGTGSLNLSHPFSAQSPLARTQYLWTASELTTAGLTSGDVTGLGIDLSTLGSNLDNLRIRIKTTTQTVLNSLSPETSGFTEVYFLNSSFNTTGNHRFNFHTPFNWDGISNLLVEFSYTNATSGVNTNVDGVNAGYNAALTSSNVDNYIDINGGTGGIQLPEGVGSAITNKVTVAFWCYGDPSRLPANTSMFEALDSTGTRQMNLHLPWSDGSIYWDCGNDGTGYDRINKAAVTSEIRGQWNFWAVTKDAITGSMKIYLNGVLWHSGTGKTKPISIKTMTLGRSAVNGYVYYGSIDEFSLWNTELSQSEVQDIMYHSVIPSNPVYSNLQVYYKLDETSGALVNDASPNGYNASMFNMTWRVRRGKDLFRNFTEGTDRPNTTFVKGVYTTSVQTTATLDSMAIPANSVVAYTVINNNLSVVDTNLLWAANGYSYTYDEAGVPIDSIAIVADDTINVSTITYYEKRPSKIELINFITPYGIGLNLNGLIGKTWAFDVTDYVKVLRGNKFMAMEGGNRQEDNDITFVFYEGTPPRNVHSLQQIWPNACWTEANYSQILNNVYFEPRDIQLSPASSQFKIRSAISGHGQEGEFISRNHTIRLNNSINFTRPVWKECATNPIYPQGGTWVYDRAGWCPGAVVDTKEYEITPNVSSGQLINLDYTLPNATNTGTSNYRINNQLVSYGAPNFTLDAAVDYVKNPTDRVEFERLNPICNQPVVAIKNTGSTVLTSLDITYGRLNGSMSTFQWTGSLNFLTSTEVTLPQPAWLSSNTNQFIVIVSNPNGAADQYGLNDTMITTFNYPTVYTNDLVFELKTNNNGSHSTYTLKDSQGNILINKLGLLANTVYRDTVILPTDCYTLQLNDAGDDGLSWWANTNQGTGYFRIKKASNGAILKTFNPDFGDNVYQQFTVNYTLPTVEIQPGQLGKLTVYPNPANDLLAAEFSLPVQTKAVVQLVNILGQTILSEEVITSQTSEKVTMDISTIDAGLYYVILSSGSDKVMQKVVITH